MPPQLPGKPPKNLSRLRRHTSPVIFTSKPKATHITTQGLTSVRTSLSEHHSEPCCQGTYLEVVSLKVMLEVLLVVFMSGVEIASLIALSLLLSNEANWV